MLLRTASYDTPTHHREPLLTGGIPTPFGPFMNDFVSHGLIKWLQEMRRPIVRVLLGALRAAFKGRALGPKPVRASSEMRQRRAQSMRRSGNRSRQVEEISPQVNRCSRLQLHHGRRNRSIQVTLRTSAQDFEGPGSPPTCPCLSDR